LGISLHARLPNGFSLASTTFSTNIFLLGNIFVPANSKPLIASVTVTLLTSSPSAQDKIYLIAGSAGEATNLISLPDHVSVSLAGGEKQKGRESEKRNFRLGKKKG